MVECATKVAKATDSPPHKLLNAFFAVLPSQAKPGPYRFYYYYYNTKSMTYV